MRSNSRTPPHLLGILLALLGSACVFGGFSVYTMGGGFYFLVVGIGLVYVGTLLFMGRMLAIWLYAGLLVVMAVLSLIDVGLNMSQLLPRLGLPLLIGVYLFSGKVRSRLA